MTRKVNILILLLGCLILLSCKDKRYFTVAKIKDAAKLATTETVIEKIVIGNKKKMILRIFTLDQARFVCYSEARIKAGIDLKKLNKEDVKIDGKQIDLLLPAVEVINFSYPFARFRIDSTLLDNGLFARISISDMEEFFRMAEKDIREQLPYMGITESTETKTRQMMESLLKSLGYVDIYIHFRKGPLIAKVNLNETQ
jgi:predicted HTH transcriptional regulator